MRIRTFNLLAQNEAEDYTLKNCPLVIDGSNFFYNAYKDSGLPFALGCECDKYEDYIRERLSMFEKANVTCYFLFKGGISDIHANIAKHANTSQAKNYNPMQKDMFIEPIFSQDVCMQVLKQMGIKYTVCKMEVKKQCMALAHDLNCPIISYDIEYCFSNIPYILSNTLNLNEMNNEINCRLFRLNNFLDKKSLSKEKLVYFILLRDENLFPEDTFINLFRHINVNWSHFKRNETLIRWLSLQQTKKDILKTIFMFINKDMQKIFLEKEEAARAFVDPQLVVGIPMKYLKNDDIVTEIDDEQFEIAVCSGQVSRHYINLYTDNFIKYHSAIDDTESINAFFTALDIVKFVYVALTDETNNEFTIYDNEGDLNVIKIDRTLVSRSIWLTIMALKPKSSKNDIFLFLRKRYDEILQRIPDDAKLLLIALTYCAVKNNHFTHIEVFSVLLCYMMLRTSPEDGNEENVKEKTSKVGPLETEEEEEPDTLKAYDDFIAIALFSKYFEITDEELSIIFDRKILHPLVEFQYCLQHLNYLNSLCKERYKTTIYSKTFNGTFIYKILYKIKNEFNNKYNDFINNELKCAPGVTAYLLDIMSTFNDMKDLMARSLRMGKLSI